MFESKEEKESPIESYRRTLVCFGGHVATGIAGVEDGAGTKVVEAAAEQEYDRIETKARFVSRSCSDDLTWGKNCFGIKVCACT